MKRWLRFSAISGAWAVLYALVQTLVLLAREMISCGHHHDLEAGYPSLVRVFFLSVSRPAQVSPWDFVGILSNPQGFLGPLSQYSVAKGLKRFSGAVLGHLRGG
jgi:hypothetical protein